jgi:glucosamine 6-phosphate synthetase-like amidotransferase/phosphosugar isomerase protein
MDTHLYVGYSTVKWKFKDIYKKNFTHFMLDQLIERSAVLREMQMKIYIFRDVT